MYLSGYEFSLEIVFLFARQQLSRRRFVVLWRLRPLDVDLGYFGASIDLRRSIESFEGRTLGCHIGGYRCTRETQPWRPQRFGTGSRLGIEEDVVTLSLRGFGAGTSDGQEKADSHVLGQIKRPCSAQQVFGSWRPNK